MLIKSKYRVVGLMSGTSLDGVDDLADRQADGEAEDGEEYVQVLTWKVRNTQLYGFGRGHMKLRFHDYGMTYSPFESEARFKTKEDAL